MTDDIMFSRPLATAMSLGEGAPDRHQFVDKRVVLTGNKRTLATRNGHEAFLLAMRLLGRMCRNLHLALPKDHIWLLREAEAVAGELQPHSPVVFGPAEVCGDYDAGLSVGTGPIQDDRWTIISSNGWLARVSSEPELDDDCGQWNPVGALAAACLGAGEVFKRLIRLKPSHGRLLKETTFSLYDYTCGGSEAGPAVDLANAFPVTLVGAGAIGNGILYLLKALLWPRPVAIVDYQAYGPENWGTCLMLPSSSIGVSKAKFAERLLKASVSAAVGFAMRIEEFSESICLASGYPDVVLVGVDSIEARHAVQGLWPTLAVDGAVGSFGCQVSCHPWGPDVACLQCLFQEAPVSASRLASEASGLSPERLADADKPLTEADVAIAPAGKRDFLRQRIGKRVCSLIQEAMVQTVSAGGLRKGFSPSVPFVACLSSAMVIGETIKAAMHLPMVPEPMFQFDVLWGPERGQDVPQRRRQDCLCAARRENINRWRARRPVLHAIPGTGAAELVINLSEPAGA